jgi:hypothetical protein
MGAPALIAAWGVELVGAGSAGSRSPRAFQSRRRPLRIAFNALRHSTRDAKSLHLDHIVPPAISRGFCEGIISVRFHLGLDRRGHRDIRQSYRVLLGSGPRPPKMRQAEVISRALGSRGGRRASDGQRIAQWVAWICSKLLKGQNIFCT